METVGPIGRTLLVCTFCIVTIACSRVEEEVIRVDVNTFLPIHITEEKYFSLGMDSNLIRNHWETWDFGSQRLRTLAIGLSPAYLRLCGTDGDRMLFKKKIGTDLIQGSASFPASNFTMSAQDWDRINMFAADVGWRILFCFNAQLRRGEHWDSNNAKDLLVYSIQEGYASNLDFELGNEPDVYFMLKNMTVLTGKQLAGDYKQLKTLLHTDYKSHYDLSKLYGPGIAFVLPIQSKSVWFLSEFLHHLEKDVMNGVTWHQYYGGSELKYVENYTDPDILDQYVTQSSRMNSAVSHSPYPDVDVWQGETSSTDSSPGNNIDVSYVAGFMLLDKLGVSAKCGMKLVIRQTFYGFWFALVDKKLNPTPNYWVGVLYMNLVGTKVLEVTTRYTTSRFIRLYANCIAAHKSNYSQDSIVIYAMNLGEYPVSLDLSSVGSRVYEYLFSPGDGEDLVATTIRLNEHVILMTDENKLPDLVRYGRPVKSSTTVIIPSKRFAFYVINDAGASACSP